MGKGMYPCEEHNGKAHDFVECDVLVKRDDPIQRRLASERDECATYWEENARHVEVEDEGRRAGDGVTVAVGGSGLG